MPAKPSQHDYVVGFYIELLDVKVLQVTVGVRPSADYVRVEHGCCSTERTYTASQLNVRRRKAKAGSLGFPKLCQKCVTKRGQKHALIEPAFREGPKWAPPADTPPTTYY